MNELNERELGQYLEDLGVDLSASEAHGLMTGYLCACDGSTFAERLAMYGEWLDTRLPEDQVSMLESLYSETIESLGEFSDHDFRPLLPRDEEPISERTAAMARWCAGFVSGFGSAGRYEQAELEADVVEAFTDLSRIAAMSEYVPDSEENETDLMEIGEYVRISVLLIFAACAGRASRKGNPVH